MTASLLYGAIARSMASRYAVYAANLLSMMILARTFTPETFGLVASVSVIYLFFQVVAEGGFGPAIINLGSLSHSARDGIFGFTLALGLLLALTVQLLSGPVADFYQTAEVTAIFPYVALAVLLVSASVIPTSFLLRDQRFRSLAKAGVSAEIVSTAAVLASSAWLAPLHALALKLPVSAAVNFVLAYKFSAATEFGRPNVGFNFSAVRPLFSFASYQLGANTVSFVGRNLDNVLVARTLGASALGIYDKAYQLMRYPLLLLTFAMTPAIQPVVRQLAHDPRKVEQIHREFAFRLSVAGGAAALGVFLLAPIGVQFVLGAQWGGAVPILQILAIGIPAQVVHSTNGSFFQAMSRPRLLLGTGVASGFVTTFAIVLGLRQSDLPALCWALVAAFHVNFLVVYTSMYLAVFKCSPGRFFLQMVPAVVIVVGMTSALLTGWAGEL
ncbi:oligosaccharide flippase family protein [Cognatilysobacter bugurensis]|uniref:Lipopolysaccharide biosynthesis protein n=1 Tax=Cognatilysobacter bugurensis TaxID=543356 RepID=A0A918SVL2_9GAMM|nr:oligosaccharide flippase family protein [Lysobacter bugurensis]GHA72962.1 lipopolysaccharide biosynthesis protein [Lysobacter bugurensis]